MKSRLKSCPFCGGESEFSEYQKFDGYMREGYTYQVRCLKCGARIEGGSAVDVFAKWESRGDSNDKGG